MKVIAADHNRSYDLPGLAEPARRPVDIDASNTGFTRLRSLRVYRFYAGSVIDGHAEEDEVFVVVTAGSVEIKVGSEESRVDAFGTYTLAAPTDTCLEPFVVYLPPRSVYQLTLHSTADVAYARATPTGSRGPAVFYAHASATSDGMTTLLEQTTHAERLRLRVAMLRSETNIIAVDIPEATDDSMEALVHVQRSPADSRGSLYVDNGTLLQLHSWDTLAFESGEHATLHATAGADLLILTVLAT